VRGKLAFLFLCTMPVTLSGQAGLGTINGTVVDHSGAVVPGSKVKIVQVSTKSTREAAANEQGIFNLPSLVPGQYTLNIKAPGFKEETLDNIIINGFQELDLGRIVLEVGAGPATSVTVTADQQLIKDSGERVNTIQADEVADTPNNGRNWANLLGTIPGAIVNNDTYVGGREYGYYGYQDYTINGKSSVTMQINLDGGSIVDHGSDQKVTVSPSLESIQEVSILTNNFTAEYGNRSGAVVNVVTKSGTNSLHGVAFDNLRNEDLNANSWSNNYTGLPRNVYRYNYFGANLGGPVKKNRVFFFYNFEDFKQNIPGSLAQAWVPTALERQGNFSQTLTNTTGGKPSIYEPGSQYSGTPVPLPGLILPQSLISPLGQAIMNLYPLPNNPNNPTLDYNLQYQTILPRLSQVAKVDFNISNSTRMYLRYSNDGSTNTQLGTYNTSAALPFNLMNQYRPDRAAAGNVTHTFSSSMVMESFFSWSYDYVSVTPTDPSAVDTSKLGLSGLPSVFKATNNILPGITISPYPTFNFNRLPAFADANEWQASTTVTWTRGTHTIKFGGQYLIDTKQEITAANDKGTYDFNTSSSPFDTGFAPANALVGALAEYTQVSSIAHKDSGFKDFQLFAQDSWRVSRGLTLNYGLRLYHMPAEGDVNPANSKDAVFLPWMYNPAMAPRYYIPNPANKAQVIDPAHPNSPLPSNEASILLYSIVPGSGSLTNGLVPLGSPGVGDAGFFSPPPIMVAPRGGFAWSPGFDSKMVIRGGFGWSYNRNTIGDTVTNFNNGLTQNVDYLQTSLATLGSSSSVARISPPATVTARDPSTRHPQTVYDYSLSVQREIPFKMVLDVAYVGNLQRHQAIEFNLNTIAPGTAFNPAYVDSTNAGYNFFGPISASNPGPLPGSNAMNALVMRPFQGFNTINDTANVGNNRFDSVQVSLQKRFGNGLSFQASYSHNRLISGVENAGLYSYNWKQFTGYPSASMRTDNLSINYLYRLPDVASHTLSWHNIVARSALDGWQFAHHLTFFGGFPFSPSFAIQEANTGTSISLPNVLMGTPDLTPRLGITGNLSYPTNGLYFNPSALSVPSIYPAGNGTGPRNYITQPGTFGNDMTMSKIFTVIEGKTLELRVSAYNAFNQVRRTGINSSITYKAQGASFSNGFQVYNTPDQLVSRLAANTNSLTAFNQYRSGVGYSNLTGTLPMRIVEVGLKFRF
jgi:hypothetical protein